MSVIAVFKLHGKLLSVQSSGKDLQNRTDHVVVRFLEESVALGWSVSASMKGFCSLVDMFRLNYFLTFHLGFFCLFFPPMVILSESTGWLFRIFIFSSLWSFVSNIQTHQLEFCCDIAYICDRLGFVFAGAATKYWYVNFQGWIWELCLQSWIWKNRCHLWNNSVLSSFLRSQEYLRSFE